jgi:hypothetical protein
MESKELPFSERVREKIKQYAAIIPTNQTPAPCVDSKPTNWCARKSCPNPECAKTCDTCVAPGPTPSEPPPPPPVDPTPAPSGAPSAGGTDPSPCGFNKALCNGAGDCCSSVSNSGRCRGNGRYRYLETEATARSSQRHLNNAPDSPPGLDRVPGLDRAKEKANLEKARGLWEKFQANSNYTFELERDIFGPEDLLGPFILEVRSGKVSKASVKSSGLPVEAEILSDIPNTLDDMFDLIQFEVNQNVATLDVEYSTLDGYGYPKVLFVARADGDVDEGVKIYFIRNFEVVEE